MANDQSIINLNLKDLLASFQSNDAFIDQSFYKYLRVAIPGSATEFQFNRTIALPTVSFVAKGASIPQSETEVTLIKNTFHRIAATPKIDVWDQASSFGVDQLSEQVEAVRRAIQRQLSFNIIEGLAPAFNGLKNQAFQTSIVNSATGALTLQDIYRAKNLMRGTGGPGRPGGPGVLCCDMVLHEKTQRELFGLLDQAGLSYEPVWDEDVGCEVMKFFGMRMFVNNSIPLNEGATLDRTSIYFLSFNSDTAVKLLYSKDPRHDCDIDGIHTYPLPVKEGTNETFAYVGGFYNLFVPESQSAVRLFNIKPTFFAQ